MILCANPNAQYLSYRDEIDNAIKRVLESKQYILGSEVENLENEFAKYIGCSSAIGVANGTDAIELSLRALDIGFGDEVITVSHTAIATVAAIECTGAKPILVDIETEFYTINPDLIEKAITNKTKAIIVVHLYGQSANLDEIIKICNKNDVFLIEDVSQAHGAKYKNLKLGNYGVVGCFSCYPTKNLGAIGDAGLVTTNNKKLGEKIKYLREYGWKKKNNSILSGRNSRLDEVQASILRVKLKFLDHFNNKRKKIAQRYINDLSKIKIILPKFRMKCTHVFHLFVIQVEKRDKFLEFLKKHDILAGIHYPIPVHLQTNYKNKISVTSSLSETEAICKKIVSLPLYPELSEEDQTYVIKIIKDYFLIN